VHHRDRRPVSGTLAGDGKGGGGAGHMSAGGAHGSGATLSVAHRAYTPAAQGPVSGPDAAGLGDLTSQAVRGHPAAIESLLEQIRPMVVRYCRARLGRITGHYHVADDVAQEVCIAVLSALPRYQDMGRPFASFVFGIASHKVADALRSAARMAVPTGRAGRPAGPGRNGGVLPGSAASLGTAGKIARAPA
jgi:RNA polymerase sigma-70 factor, ECF subfamily